jgi:hypothetical protein
MQYLMSKTKTPATISCKVSRSGFKTQNYILWQKVQRLRFPGNKLFTDPNSVEGYTIDWKNCRGICIWPIKREESC